MQATSPSAEVIQAMELAPAQKQCDDDLQK
jgi:hypothetical protein